MARTVEDFIINFADEEESGGGGVRVKPGTYRVKIIAAKTGTSENQGTKFLAVVFRFLDGQYAKKKTKLEERLYLSPKAYSRFRLLMEAVDMKAPAKLNLIKLIPKLKGKELYIEVDDDEREGYKTRSRVTFQGFINPDDYDPDAEGDDEELEEEEDEDEDELEDEDEEEEEDEDEEPPARERKAKPAARKRTKKRAEPEEDEDEDDEDEEEEPPARKRRAKKAPAKKSRKSKAADEDDEDEDDDLNDLDLDEM